jgi:hypothetical protein
MNYCSLILNVIGILIFTINYGIREYEKNPLILTACLVFGLLIFIIHPILSPCPFSCSSCPRRRSRRTFRCSSFRRRKAKVPTKFSSKQNNKNEDIECIICYDTITSDKITLSCNHIYHKKCINTWKRTNPTCPVCRKRI